MSSTLIILVSMQTGRWPADMLLLRFLTKNMLILGCHVLLAVSITQAKMHVSCVIMLSCFMHNFFHMLIVCTSIALW